jgi:MarR family transcriptional regulator, organic hydroperoxide resistance regulator
MIGTPTIVESITSYREAAVSDVRDIEDPLALERQVCFALAVASRNVIAVYRPLLEPMGLTHPQYLVMLALWERSPLSVKELSGLLQLDPGTLSPLLKRLEAGGLISRGRDSDDERVLAVTLTERGRALRAEAEKIPPTIVDRLGMEIAELEDLHAALTRLIGAAKNAVR